MLDQVVYTRCYPSRVLSQKGQVKNTEGYGVFSVSQELFSNPRINDFERLTERLSIENGAKNTMPREYIKSYEYSVVAPDLYALTYEVSLQVSEELRKTGMSHRGDIYLKQSLIGDIEGYPADWFGANAWDAHLLSQSYYYMDGQSNPEPPFLPQASPAPNGGYMTFDKVRSFINDGRAELLKTAVWFLMRELEKPEGERKVLVIKDYPEQVELWVAAIEYGFSAKLAQTIPFTTNCGKIRSNTENILFYYTDQNGNFLRNVANKRLYDRHPNWMIAGYHPTDQMSTGLRQLPVSNFVILDGVEKTIGVEPDGMIYQPYFTALTQYGEEIQDFCSIVLPSLPIPGVSTAVPELFDAYQYVLDEAHTSDRWTYKDAVKHLKALMRYGVSTNRALNDYMLTQCLEAYDRFASQDEQNGFILMKIMWNLAVTTQRELDVSGCLTGRMQQELDNLSTNNQAIAELWNGIQAAGIDVIARPTLQKLFEDFALIGYAKKFESVRPNTVHVIVDLFFRALAAQKIDLEQIGGSKEKYNFVCLAIVALRGSEQHLGVLLNKISKAEGLFYSVVLSVADYYEKHMPSCVGDWWNVVLRLSGGNVVELCRKLCDSEYADMDMVEALLTNRISGNQSANAPVFKAFAETAATLGKKPETGKLLYENSIAMAQLTDVPSLIVRIRQAGVSRPVEEYLFRRMDAKLLWEVANGMAPVISREINDWAHSLGLGSAAVAYDNLKREVKRERNAERMISLLYTFAGNNYGVRERFAETPGFKGLVDATAKTFHPEMHIAVLCAFYVERRSVNAFVDFYVTLLLDDCGQRELLNRLMSLCEAAEYTFVVPGRPKEYVEKVQDAIELALKNHMTEIYRPMLAMQVRHLKCDEDIREKLVEMIEKAAPRKNAGRLGDKINKLFKK